MCRDPYSLRPTLREHLQALPCSSSRLAHVNGARHSRPSASGKTQSSNRNCPARDGARLVRAEHSIARVETKQGLIVTNRESNDRSAAGRNGHICRILTGAWDVRNQALGLEETVAAGLAAVVVEEGAAEAPGAVLALLVGAEAAELAGRGGVLVGGAPAAVADFLAHNAAPLALEGGEAPPAELGDDTERSHPGGAALDALAVEHVPTIAALHGARAK